MSETEVPKIFTADTSSDIGSEAEKMKFANTIKERQVREKLFNKYVAKKKQEMALTREYFLNR